MELYVIFFILSTLWVGPFWFSMMFSPTKEKTKKLMSTPLFFIGPILIWIIIMVFNPSGIIELMKSGSHPDGFLFGIAEGLKTEAGITAMWAHMVAGDICMARWIWSDGIKTKTNQFVLQISLFFAVMLMPVGIFIYLISKLFRK